MAAAQVDMLPALTISHGPCQQRKRLMPLTQVSALDVELMGFLMQLVPLMRAAVLISLQLQQIHPRYQCRPQSRSNGTYCTKMSSVQLAIINQPTKKLFA
jgi:hypothetical protein